MEEFKVRAAQVPDAMPIAMAITRAWRSAYAHIIAAEKLAEIDIEARAARFEEKLKSTSDLVWVADLGGQVVGVVSLGLNDEEEHCRGDLFVTALYVDPSFHGRGAGRALMRQALDVAHRKEFGRLSLATFVENANARAFYKACGGTEYAFGPWMWQEVEYPVAYIWFKPEPL